MGVEVAEVLTPKFVAGVNGNAEPPVIAPQATTPEVLVVRALEPLQPEIPETVRFVVEAVAKYPVPETERAVVLAYGKVEAELEVEVMVPPTNKLLDI